mgnify:CR=1 FL=1
MVQQLQNELEQPKINEDELFVLADYDQTAAEKSGYSNYSYWKSVWANFLKKKPAVIMSIMFLLLFIFTFVASAIGKYDIHMAPDPLNRMYISPNNEYWFGTNAIGQDLWARVWSGTRTSLIIGFIVAFVEAIIGITIGVLWGYVRKLDRLLTEVYNVIDNIPSTIILVLATYVMRPSVLTLIIAMCITGWIGLARFIRNQIVIIRDRDYNLASRCLGTGTGRIIFKNLLPYLVSVIMLRMALAIPGAIGSEVFLTYVGLGLPIQIPSLGNLVDEGRKVMLVEAQRYQLMFPMLMTSAITVSFYALGNAFADASDPRNHR